MKLDRQVPVCTPVGDGSDQEHRHLFCVQARIISKFFFAMFHPEPPRKDTVLPSDPETADDLGETKYFHGRKKEVGYFLRRLSESKDRKVGTIFLVQKPPGVGKTALLGKCRKRAEREGWNTAAETHGWGHHIASYLDPAPEYLKKSKGEMIAEGLRIVREKGRANRWAYYTGRTEGLDDDRIIRLVKMFRYTPAEEGFQKQNLVAKLDKPGFAQAVSKGVLYYSNPLYTLPIPSLYDCLTERASRIREATLRYERVKKQIQTSRHRTTDSPFPEKDTDMRMEK